MENLRDPREHVNEEPSNDMFDFMFGFGGFMGLLTVIFIGMVIVKAVV